MLGRAYEFFWVSLPGRRVSEEARLEEIRGHGYVLTQGRYVVAAAAEEDNVLFEAQMAGLTAKLGEQFQESARLEMAIWENLRGQGYEL